MTLHKMELHVTKSEKRQKEHVGQKEQHPRQGRRGTGQGKGPDEGSYRSRHWRQGKKAEGRSDQTKGTAKDKVAKAKDLLK